MKNKVTMVAKNTISMFFTRVDNTVITNTSSDMPPITYAKIRLLVTRVA